MPHPITPHPFLPLTDPEYDILSAYLPPAGGRPGRPPQDRRRTLDAIFWVACSKLPWKDLPERFGRPDSASRALRRWARSGHLDALLAQVADEAARNPLWRALAWRICRAWRRVSRIVTLSQLLMAKRLNLRAALPAAPCHLPDPDLSKTVQAMVVGALKRVHEQPRGTFRLLGKLLMRAGGNRRHWRTR